MTSLVLVHGGQTGADRGAHVGAVDVGLALAGYMPRNCRDEYGPIPHDVRQHLKRCTIDGYEARTLVNLDISTALLVVVSDAQHPYRTPGTRMTLEAARNIRKRRDFPSLVIDPSWPHERVHAWVAGLLRKTNLSELRLMVAGPRSSRWASGEVETAAFVRALAGLKR